MFIPPMPRSRSTRGSHGPLSDADEYTVVVHAAAFPPGHLQRGLLKDQQQGFT